MAVPAPVRRVYEFGPFRLDAGAGVLLRHGEPVPLTPKVIELLAALVRNSGNVVRKEDLMQAVWPDAAVEESNLTHNIAVLRKALGQGAEGRPYIETLAKRGYRFVGAVRLLPEPPQDPSGEPLVPRVAPQRRLPAGLVLRIVVAGTALACAALVIWGLLPGRKVSPVRRQTGGFSQLTNQPGQETHPNLSPDGASFVYAARTPGNWDIYLQRIGGRNAVNLTGDSPADDRQPAFSPDGRYIAFRSERANGGIFVMGASGESVRMAADFGYDPSWSPTGDELVFSTVGFFRVDDRFDSLNGRLCALHLATGEKRFLTPANGDAVQPAWSPHGHRVAYWGAPGGKRIIWTVPARAQSGGASTAVPVVDDQHLNWNPVWSHDGRHLYFCSNRGGSMNLWRAPIDELTGKVLGSPEPVTAPAIFSGFLSVSRDGTRIAYAAETRTANLVKADFDPAGETVVGTPRAITRGSWEAVFPHVSPGGGWLVFCTRGKQEDLWVVRTDGSGLRALTDDIHRDRSPVWSPGGQWIAFYSNRSGQWQNWIIRPDGSGLKQITFREQGDAFAPVWSPDGRRMLSNVVRSAPIIVEVDKPWREQAPEVLPLPAGQQEFLARSWSADGRRLVGSVRRGDAPGTRGIWVYSFQSRTYQRLTDSGSNPQWLGDCRRVLFSDPGGIRLIDSVSRRPRMLLSLPPHWIWPASLAPDDRAFYFPLVTTESDVWLMNLE